MEYIVRFEDPYDGSIQLEYYPSQRQALNAAAALERIGIPCDVVEQARR